VDQRDLVLYMTADALWKSIDDILSATESPKCGVTGTCDLTTIMANVLEETFDAR
jgi:hypothetical protein